MVYWEAEGASKHKIYERRREEVHRVIEEGGEAEGGERRWKVVHGMVERAHSRVRGDHEGKGEEGEGGERGWKVVDGMVEFNAKNEEGERGR